MSLRVVFLAVLAVALVNVLSVLYWPSPPVAPPPKAVSAAPPLPPSLSPPVPAQPDSPPSDSSNAPPLPNDVDRAQAPTASMAKETAPPDCHVAACEAAYRSFRASDCTYQPNNGPRRVCKKK